MTNHDCVSRECNSNHVIHINHANNDSYELKANEVHDTNNVLYDCLINGYSSLNVQLSLFFSAYLRQGMSPDNMLLTI